MSVDPEQPIRASSTMEQLAQDSLVARGNMVNLLTGFSAPALFLACLLPQLRDALARRTAPCFCGNPG